MAFVISRSAVQVRVLARRAPGIVEVLGAFFLFQDRMIVGGRCRSLERKSMKSLRLLVAALLVATALPCCGDDGGGGLDNVRDP
jgi:hypothetical protein